MLLRKAQPTDLPKLTEVYTSICRNMRSQGIELWNEHYPADVLPDDIAAGILWTVCDGETIAGAFAIDRDIPCTDVNWQDPLANAAILMRLGVSAEYQGKGVGRLCMQLAEDTARSQGYGFLRLLVVDFNTPAERFYRKYGCVKAPGVHIQRVEGIDEELREYGYEIKL